MTSHLIQLRVTVDAGGASELFHLARRNTTTAKRLCQMAVRQLIGAARSGTMPDLPPLGPADPHQVVTVWLQPPDRDLLDQLAADHRTTAAALASLAVRQMLAQARAGATPMVTPLRPPEPDIKSEPWEHRAARCNFEKARLTVDKLVWFAEVGIDPAKPRDYLAVLDSMRNFPPS